MITRGRFGRCRSAGHKFGWGLRVVGPFATAAGVARYLRIRVGRPSSTVLPIRSGGELEVGVPDQLITTLAVFGDLIDPEYGFLRQVMRPDAVVVDVGAGVGQFSVFAARNGAGVVHAVEPDDENAAVLRRNTVRNGIDGRVVMHRMAFGERAGAGSLVTAPGVVGPRFNGRIMPAAVGARDVPVERLDAWVESVGLDRIDVLKVNVAGDEATVLRGGWALFERSRVDVLVVLIGIEVVDTLSELAANGYRWFLHDPGRGTLHECRNFDERFLTWRPFPARHVLGVSRSAVDRGVVDGFRLVPALR